MLKVRSLKVRGNGAIRPDIHYVSLVVCCNNVTFLHQFRDIVTFPEIKGSRDLNTGTLFCE